MNFQLFLVRYLFTVQHFCMCRLAYSKTKFEEQPSGSTDKQEINSSSLEGMIAMEVWQCSNIYIMSS